jgi:putative ubiquitin-RnfH superfamily antitoxin RatB of RatAB toxin-antitoxin module
MPDLMMIEVSYALPDKQIIIPIKCPKKITVKAAIEKSGILKKFSDINLNENQVGIFGKLTSLVHNPRDKDRIEIYRPLIADPKEIRRKRAAEGKNMKKGD